MTLDTGLDQASLEAIQHVLGEFPGVEQAILYGSRAMGTHRAGSDIDLTLKGVNLTRRDLLNIDLALDDLLLPWKFDLSLYRDIENPELIEHISRVGKVMFEQVK